MATEIDALPTSKSLGWTDALITRLAANSFGLGGRLSITAPANASALSSSGYSLTGSNASSMIDLAGTLNTTGSPSIIKVAMSNTASGATTKFLSCLAGASGTTEVFSVGKDGVVLGPNIANAFADTLETNSGFGFSSGNPLVQKAGTSIASALSSGWQVLALSLGATIGSPDTFAVRDAANTLALRNSTNAQAFNIYNTYTSGSVYERGFMRWVGDVLKIGTEAVGGTVRNLRLFGGPTAPGVIQFENSVVIVGPMLGLGVSQGDISPSASAFFYTPSNGVLRITDSTQANFNRLQFGGTTSSFPALKRSSTVLQARLADDSDFAPFAASTLALTTPVNTSALSSTGYSLTGSNAQSMIDLAGTWNTTGTPTLIKANVTDTASNAASLLMDLQVGGVSKLSLTKSSALSGDASTGLTVNFGTLTHRSGANCGYTYSGGHRLSLGLNGYIAWGTTNDTFAATGLWLGTDAANTLALRNAANAQAFNIYGTYTSGSVYERMFARYSVANGRYEIGTEHLGASARDLMLMRNGSGVMHFKSGAVDIGSQSVQLLNNSTLLIQEMTPPTGAAGFVRVYCDSSGGKTRLMAIFGSGAAQQIAIEP